MNCDETFRNEDLKEVEVGGDTEHLCESCIDELDYCDECLEINRSVIEMVDGQYLCCDCRPKDCPGQQVFAWEPEYFCHANRTVKKYKTNNRHHRQVKRREVVGPLDIMWPRDFYGNVILPAGVDKAYVIWRGELTTVPMYRKLVGLSRIIRNVRLR